MWHSSFVASFKYFLCACSSFLCWNSCSLLNNAWQQLCSLTVIRCQLEEQWMTMTDLISDPVLKITFHFQFRYTAVVSFIIIVSHMATEQHAYHLCQIKVIALSSLQDVCSCMHGFMLHGQRSVYIKLDVSTTKYHIC